MATGFLVAVLASRYSVEHLTKFAAGTRIPPFIIGITLVSIGTDLPEIANSIVASVTGHGDVNVGDSIGSAVVQSTLILGLLPLIAGAFPIARGRVTRIGAATAGALLLGAAVMADGHLSRLDALLLIGAWILGTAVVWRDQPADAQPLVKTGGEKSHAPPACHRGPDARRSRRDHSRPGDHPARRGPGSSRISDRLPGGVSGYLAT